MTGRMTKAKGFCPRNVQDVPKQSGIYVLKSQRDVPQYVGMAKAGNLQKRLMSHLNENDVSSAEKFSFRPTSSSQEAQSLEQSYIDRLNPKQNKT